MKRAIITPAALAPAALAELKDWLGITTRATMPQLTALLRAALELCEDFTGTMPLQQVCEEVLPVAASWQALAARPVQAITAVEGIPAEGARFALPVSAYAIELDADGGGRVRVDNPGRGRTDRGALHRRARRRLDRPARSAAPRRAAARRAPVSPARGRQRRSAAASRSRRAVAALAPAAAGMSDHPISTRSPPA